MSAFTRSLSTNNYGPAKFIVSALTYEGTHSTIQAAITAASSGDTIFIRPGTYTENLTLKVGVNLTAYGCDSSLTTSSNVIILGTCTLTTAGTVTISGVQLKTNSAAFLAVTGTLASIVNLNNCYLNCINATGITHSSSNASSAINISYCNGDIGTTGISLFTSTSAGNMYIDYSAISNSGLTTTASTVSTGIIYFSYTIILFPLSTSSVGLLIGGHSSINTSFVNTACITTVGTGSANSWEDSIFSSGTASALSIGSGTIIGMQSVHISSSNTNAVTGAGTISYSNVVFNGSSSLINTTTKSYSYVDLGKYKSVGQPSFLAQVNADVNNVTGDGTAYTVIFNTAITNVGSHYSTSTGLFTAPDAGLYQFSGTVNNLNGNANAVYNVQIVCSSAGTFRACTNSGQNNLNVAQSFSITILLVASETVKIVSAVSGTTKTIGIQGTAGTFFNWFSGSKIG